MTASETESDSKVPQLPTSLGEAPLQLQQSGSDAFKLKCKAGRPSAPCADSTGSVTESHQAELANAEPSEEELLQWRPVFPAKKQPAKFRANDKQDGKAMIRPKKPDADTAAARTQPPPVAVDSSPSSQLRSASSVPSTSIPAISFPATGIAATSIPATSNPVTSIPATDSVPATRSTSSEACEVPAFLRMAARPAVTPAKLMGLTVVEANPLQTLITYSPPPAMAVSSHHLSSSPSLPASSAVPAGFADYNLRSASSVSSLNYALHAKHAAPPQLALSLPPVQSAPHGFPLPASSPAAAAAALLASTDSDWPAVHAPEHRQSISSWSSQASETPTLRHSIASISSIQCTDNSSIPDTEYPVTAVINSEAMESVPDLPDELHLLDTKELQAQTAALLSSLTTSTDWDCVPTDAPQHGQAPFAEQQNQSVTDPHAHSVPGSRALSQSVDSELLSSTLATTDLARPDYAEATGGNVGGLTASSSCSSTASTTISGGSNSRGRASGGHSPASSLSSSGQLSLASLASGAYSFSCVAMDLPNEDFHSNTAKELSWSQE